MGHINTLYWFNIKLAIIIETQIEVRYGISKVRNGIFINGQVIMKNVISTLLKLKSESPLFCVGKTESNLVRNMVFKAEPNR